VAVGRREAALRRPSPVLGTSTYDRYGSAAAVLGSNEIVSLTPLSPIRGHQLGPTDKEICRILAHRDRLDALKEPAREGAHQRKDHHSGRCAGPEKNSATAADFMWDDRRIAKPSTYRPDGGPCDPHRRMTASAKCCGAHPF